MFFFVWREEEKKFDSRISVGHCSHRRTSFVPDREQLVVPTQLASSHMRAAEAGVPCGESLRQSGLFGAAEQRHS